MPKPDVDEITGLSPAISIDQKSRSNNPRSTVATITEIYDYLRVLYARIGKPYSPLSGHLIKKMSQEEITNFIIQKIRDLDKEHTGKKTVMGVSWSETKITLASPVVVGRKGEFYQVLYDALGKGYTFAMIDGNVKNLRERVELSKTRAHDIDLFIDQFQVHELVSNERDFLMRLTESIEKSLEESKGFVKIIIGDPDSDTRETHLFSASLICPEDGFSFPEIEPRLFSFNSPYGACPECNGLGVKHLFGNENDDDCEVCRGARLRSEAMFVFLGASDQSKKYVSKIDMSYSVPSEPHKKWEKVGLNIFEFAQLSIEDAHTFIFELSLSDKDREIAEALLNEIESRLRFLLNVGLEYLTLNRRAGTLSGGESQRIRLASQLGSQLVGALYVLDEPTIGLHQRDNDRLIKTLIQLRDLGNTIIVVEHDEDVMHASDYMIEIGPGAGIHGGNIVVADYTESLLAKAKNTNNSSTLAYLRGEKMIRLPQRRRENDKGVIVVKNASVNNIKNLSIEIPLGRLVVISGVSGSGKSTFMYEVLNKNLIARYERKNRSAKAHNCEIFEGHNSLTRTILIDQSSIGRTPRSNPATYTGAWQHIRDMFATTDEAKIRGWKSGRFSFNVKGGRCEACEGRGEIAVEMHFLPTVYVMCDVCNGKRFEKETLKVTYKGKNVHQVLSMTIDEAVIFFKDVPAIYDRMFSLQDVGLGYIKLGQSANTLSGGESQRVKIASELYVPLTQRTIYLLDEPTVGLHFSDVDNLVKILNRLVERGNTVVVIEHNLDIVKCADHIIDFGPEGGQKGGKIVAQGTPEDVANSGSHTGHYLKKILKASNEYEKKYQGELEKENKKAKGAKKIKSK